MVVIGIDQHKRFSVAVSLDTDTGEVTTTRLEHTDPDRIRDYVGQWTPGVPVTLESGGSWYWLYDLLEEQGAEVTLCNATETRRLWRMRAKTDRLDALGLAALTAQGLVPTVYVPPRDIRDARERHRYRIRLIRMRSKVKNTIHAVLSKLGIQHPFSDLFGKAGRRFLDGLEVRPPYAGQLQSALRLLDGLEAEIKGVEKQIRRCLQDDRRAALLQSIPGVAELTAHLLLYEIGPVERFADHKRFTRYACVAPGTWQSAGHRRSPGVGRAGNLYLKAALTEAARTAVRVDPVLGAFYRRLKAKKGARQAMVAAARKLGVAVYYVLKRQEPYRPASPMTRRRSGKPVSCLGRSA
jgi:transposase